MQAANCVVRRGARLIGENTGGKGTAKERGCETQDGLEMLVGQGVIGVEHWTGSTPDPQVTRRPWKPRLPRPEVWAPEGVSVDSSPGV